MSQIVTQAEFARLQGVDKAVITRLKKADRLVMDGDRVNVEASRARIAETADARYQSKQTARNAPQGQNAGAHTQPPQDHTERAAMGLQQARAVKESYLARQAKLNYERDIGKLVEADAVRLFAADLGATFRAALEILPDRLAAELVPLNDADAIRAVLVEEFERVLLDVSEKIGKGTNHAT